jgi:hypothetical protein
VDRASAVDPGDRCAHQSLQVKKEDGSKKYKKEQKRQKAWSYRPFFLFAIFAAFCLFCFHLPC